MDLISFPSVSAFMFAGFLVGVVLFVFWIWMIIDCAKRNFKNNVEKIVWIVVIIFVNWIGALAYLLAVYILNPKGILKK
jgi:hypothetical protein